MQFEARVIKLEEQIAFIDQTMRDLTNSIDSLYKEQLKLRQHINSLNSKLQHLQNLLETDNAHSLIDQIPPHY